MSVLKNVLSLGVDPTGAIFGIAKAQKSFDRLQRTMLRTARRQRQLSRSSTGLGRRLVTLGASFVGLRAITRSIELAAEFDSAKASLEVMLGSATKAATVFKDIRKFAAKTPFRLENLVAATNQLLLAGESAKSAKDQIRILADAAALTGARANLSLGRLTLAFSQIRNSSRLISQDMRQIREVGIPAFAILAKVRGVSRDLLIDQIRAGKITGREAFKQLLEGFSKFEGTSDRLAKSLGGVLSTFKDEINVALANTAQALIDLGGGSAGIRKVTSEITSLGVTLTNTVGILSGVPDKTQAADERAQKFAKTLKVIRDMLTIIVGASIIRGLQRLRLTLAANPFIAIAIGVAELTSIIIEFSRATVKAISDIDLFRRASDKFKDSLRDVPKIRSLRQINADSITGAILDKTKIDERDIRQAKSRTGILIEQLERVKDKIKEVASVPGGSFFRVNLLEKVLEPRLFKSVFEKIFEGARTERDTAILKSFSGSFSVIRKALSDPNFGIRGGDRGKTLGSSLVKELAIAQGILARMEASTDQTPRLLRLEASIKTRIASIKGLLNDPLLKQRLGTEIRETIKKGISSGSGTVLPANLRNQLLSELKIINDQIVKVNQPTELPIEDALKAVNAQLEKERSILRATIKLEKKLAANKPIVPVISSAQKAAFAKELLRRETFVDQLNSGTKFDAAKERAGFVGKFGSLDPGSDTVKRFDALGRQIKRAGEEFSITKSRAKAFRKEVSELSTIIEFSKAFGITEGQQRAEIFNQFGDLPEESIQKVIKMRKAVDDLQASQDTLNNLAQDIASGITDPLDDVFSSILDGSKSASQALEDLGKSILSNLANSLFSNLITGPLNKAISLAFTPMATGGIVTSPTLALIGENGPEAVIPLSGPNQSQQISGNQESFTAPSVVMNIFTPNSDSFRASSLQIVREQRRALS